MTVTDLRYPIGRFERVHEVTEVTRREWIDAIAEAPAALRRAVTGLGEEQLETPYRPGGWTLRQVVHHLPDSHLNAYLRCKLALTEEEPTIKIYMEDRWAELPEARTAPVEVSLALLDALHRRWVMLLKALPAAAFQRRLHHPEWGSMSLDDLLGMYAWHGRHHVAHITGLLARMGWASGSARA